jgi:hypothetical protein
VQYLEVMGQQGRNDYPIPSKWDLLLVGIVFQHEGIEALRRELARNPPEPDGCLRLDPLKHRSHR